jgi:hypothetical protein
MYGHKAQCHGCQRVLRVPAVPQDVDALTAALHNL